MYFITGATGLIGGEITKALALKGETIKVLHRTSSDTKALDSIDGKIIKVEGDLFDSTLLEKELEDVHTIIHCAALVSFKPKDIRALEHINIKGTKSLVDAAVSSNVEKFIHISSIAAIGRTKDQKNIDETNQWVNSKYNSNYAKSKHLSELEVWRGFEEGLKGFILNPSIVLGKGNWKKGSSALFKLVYDQKKFHPYGSFNFVDLRDLRDVTLRLIEQDVNHERFIINSNKVTYKDFFTQASREFSISNDRKEITRSQLKTLKLLGQLRAFFTNSHSPITTETIRSLDSDISYDNSKIKNLLTFEFRTLDNTLKDVIPYYIKRNNLY